MSVVNDWSCQVRECLQDTEHVIFASDSNFARDSNIDRCKEVGGRRVANTDHDASETLYHHFIAETGLVDSWHECHGNVPGYTRSGWGRAEGAVVGGSRIDHIYMSESLNRGVTGVGVKDGAGFIHSDHHMIVTEVCMKVVLGMDLRRHGMAKFEANASDPPVAFHKFNKSRWEEYGKLMGEWWNQVGEAEWGTMGRGECDMDRVGEHLVEVDAWISDRMKVVASAVVGVVDANWASRHRKKARQDKKVGDS